MPPDTSNATASAPRPAAGGVAAALNARGVRTARGGRWAATQVGAALARAESPRVWG